MVEANRRMAGLIAANLAGAEYELLQSAVSQTIGTAPFHISSRSTQTSSLIRTAVDPDAETTEVPTQTLDQICADLEHVDVLKIDVQGAEADVLHGGRSTLSRTRTVLIEISFMDPDPAKVLGTLQAEFGSWTVLNPVHLGADLVFERQAVGDHQSGEVVEDFARLH